MCAFFSSAVPSDRLRRWTQLQRSAHAPGTPEEHEAFRTALGEYGGCIADPALAAQLRVFR